MSTGPRVGGPDGPHAPDGSRRLSRLCLVAVAAGQTRPQGDVGSRRPRRSGGPGVPCTTTATAGCSDRCSTGLRSSFLAPPTLPAGPPSDDAVLVTCAYLVEPSTPWVMQSLFLAAIGDARDKGARALETFSYGVRRAGVGVRRFQVHKTIFPRDFLSDFGFVTVRAAGRVELARLEFGGLQPVEQGRREKVLRSSRRRLRRHRHPSRGGLTDPRRRRRGSHLRRRVCRARRAPTMARVADQVRPAAGTEWSRVPASRRWPSSPRDLRTKRSLAPCFGAHVPRRSSAYRMSRVISATSVGRQRYAPTSSSMSRASPSGTAARIGFSAARYSYVLPGTSSRGAPAADRASARRGGPPNAAEPSSLGAADIPARGRTEPRRPGRHSTIRRPSEARCGRRASDRRRSVAGVPARGRHATSTGSARQDRRRRVAVALCDDPRRLACGGSRNGRFGRHGHRVARG